MTRAVRAAGAVLALVCVASTAACSDDDARNATTTAAEAPRCVVSDPQGELILHPGSVTAPASGTTLGGVDLTDADNVEVEQTFTVAFSGIPSVRGVILDYPPMKNAGLADGLADWDQRQPLEGRTITADDGQQAVLVVVRLSDPAKSGHLAGVALHATPSGSSEDTRRLAQPLLVKPHGKPCTVDDIAAARSWTD